MLPSLNTPGGAGFQDWPFLLRLAWSDSQPVSQMALPLLPTARLVPPTSVIHGSLPGYCSGVSSPKSPVAKLTPMPSTVARCSTPSQAVIMLCGTGM